MDLNILESQVRLQIAINLAKDSYRFNITAEDIQNVTEVSKEYFIRYIKNETTEINVVGYLKAVNSEHR